MNVDVIEATDDPDKVACIGARNDYLGDYVGGMTFREIMGPSDGETLEEKQRSLLTHLMKHGHFGPFEHPQITFAVEGMSRSCMAQLTRHRHVSFDVQSMRYVKFDEMDAGDAVIEIPELHDSGLCGRSATYHPDIESWDPDMILEERQRIYSRAIKKSFIHYEQLLDLGVAPENARMVLPIGTKVNVVFSLNARMLMHIADMRAAADAQWEIRGMTEQILDHAKEWAPLTFELYDEILKGRKNRLAP